MYQGEERVITISIENDSSAEDLSTYTDILAFVHNNRQQVAKYSLNALAGYDTLTIDGTDTSKLIFTLLRTVTKVMKTGRMDIEILGTRANGEKVVCRIDNIELKEAYSKSV
jgi:hypothetical protein